MPRYTRWMAVVPLDAASVKGEPEKVANSRSRRSTNGPPEIQVECSASTRYCSSRPQKSGCSQGMLEKVFIEGDTKREAIPEAKGQDRFLRFFELASVFVRLDHVSSLIVNANHSGVRTAVKLRVALVR